LPFFHIFTIGKDRENTEENCEKILKIWKKDKSNSVKIGKNIEEK
jgi:hypothetical protein